VLIYIVTKERGSFIGKNNNDMLNNQASFPKPVQFGETIKQKQNFDFLRTSLGVAQFLGVAYVSTLLLLSLSLSFSIFRRRNEKFKRLNVTKSKFRRRFVRYKSTAKSGVIRMYDIF